jgi:hypothetical protein
MMACRAAERRVSKAGRSDGGCSSSGRPLRPGAQAAGLGQAPASEPAPAVGVGCQAPHSLQNRAAFALKKSRRCAHGLTTGGQRGGAPTSAPTPASRTGPGRRRACACPPAAPPSRAGRACCRAAQRQTTGGSSRHSASCTQGGRGPSARHALQTSAGAVRRSGRAAGNHEAAPEARAQPPSTPMWWHAVLPRSAQRRAVLCATHAVHEPARRPAVARQRARLQGVHHVGPLLVVDARAPARVPKVHLVGQRVRQQAGHDVKGAQRVAQVGRRPRPLICAAQRLPSVAPPTLRPPARRQGARCRRRGCAAAGRRCGRLRGALRAGAHCPSRWGRPR